MTRPPVTIVALDGPGASGKSTVARGVARALKFIYVDTGAMYRTLAWHCVSKGVDLTQPKAIAAACKRWKTQLHLVPGDPPELVLLVDGHRPTSEIRTRRVSEAASDVAVVPAVRRWMRQKQRECAEFGSLVMEGRDIGSNIFPESNFKFWLDASADERARRRRAQGIEDNLPYRDRQDSQRAAAPLMPGLGARRVDTTARSAGEVIELIVSEVLAAVEAKASDTSQADATIAKTTPRA